MIDQQFVSAEDVGGSFLINEAPEKILLNVNGVTAEVGLPWQITTVYVDLVGRSLFTKVVEGRQVAPQLPEPASAQLRGNAQAQWRTAEPNLLTAGAGSFALGMSDCCIDNGTPGCDDPDCEATVCAADPFCCATSWDGICAGEAADLCGDLCAIEVCVLDPPCEGNEEPEACGEDSNGGCNGTPQAFTSADCGSAWCGTAWADGGTRDTDWYLVNHGGGLVTGDLVSEFPGVSFVVDGIAACAPVVAGDIGCSAECAPIAQASADLAPGMYVVFVATGDCAGGGIFEGFPCGASNNYSLLVGCTAIETECGNGICEFGEDNGNCPADCFCGNGSVDPGEDCDPPDGVVCGDDCQFLNAPSDCCVANGTPGCDCPACEAIVCGLDPFCCDTSWDSICAGEAADFCGDLCETNICEAPECGDGTCDPGEDNGSCPEDCFCGNGSVDPGEECDPPDGVTCDDNCQIILAGCGDPGSGDCCSANGTPACDDADCCNLVCGLDPFCCDSSWDGICAGEAEDFCGDLCIIPACDLDPPCEGNEEPEACGEDTNGGCNSVPPAFTEAACGSTWCGTAWADGGTRDTDWYLVNHGGGLVTGDLRPEFEGVTFIVDGIAACAPVVAGDIGCGAGCAPIAQASADLAPGLYVVFVAAGDCAGGGIFEGIPCGEGNDYELLVGCTPLETECGNGICEFGEDGDNCPADCFCGNGTVDPGEECDPPDGVSCDDNCELILNDECDEAIPLDVPPGGSVDIDGSTVNATFDGTPFCGTDQTAPGVWYDVVGNGNTMTASTCNQANYDTKITIFCGDCPAGGAGSDCCIPNGTPGCDDPDCEAIVCGMDAFCCDTSWDSICAGEAADFCGDLCGGGDGGLICVDGLDDTGGCGGFTTELSWCAKAGATYHILVHGFSTAVGDFTLTVSDNGSECTPGVDCPVGCEVDEDCPDGFQCVDGDCVEIPTGGCCQCDGTEQICTVETEADCEALGGQYLGDDASCESAGETVVVDSAPNIPIPDNDAGGAVDTINMGMSFPIVDLDVDLSIDHTWVGDLCVTLSHNGGPEVEILRRPGLDPDTCGPGSCCGCSNDNYSGLILDDEGGGGAIEDQCGSDNLSSPPNYTPNNPLSAFDGEDSSGDWTLTVRDGAGADTGTLVSWSLHFTGPASGETPCEAAGHTCAVERTLIIKQGACPAPVNPNSNGVIPMVLVGEDDFDVSTVDVESLALHLCDGDGGIAPINGPPGPKVMLKDLNHPFPDDISCEDGPCACNADQSSDGIDDLSMKFSTSELMDAFGGALVPGQTVILELTGSTSDGEAFYARDCVVVVPPGSGEVSAAMASPEAPDAYFEFSPSDLNLDSGGFGDITATYIVPTVMSVTADGQAPNGSRFLRWMINGQPQLRGQRTVQVLISNDDISMEAVYELKRRQIDPGQQPEPEEPAGPPAGL